MRAYKRYDRRGFTLVELMIVVAIIGVLAALAIYGVNRYLASAKTSEAKNTVGAISRGAQAAYERETTASELTGEGQNSTAANHALCTTASVVPTTVPSNTKYQPNTLDGEDFESGDSLTGWKCLKFSMNQPIYYQYNYHQGNGYVAGNNPALPDATGFEAAAVGDLDGDQSNSIFARTGQLSTNASHELIVSTQVYIENEYE